MADFRLLFEPFSNGKLNLRNRIVMAPMTRYASADGIPTKEVADYYRRRAEGEVGLVITEGVGIDRRSASRDPSVPNFFGRRALENWRKVVAAVHSCGAEIAPQLWHVGASPPKDPDWDEPVRESPSGIFGEGIERGQAMDEAAIAGTIEAYASAAEETKRMGCGAVELHGAHGYLIDQFFWEVTNRRNDPYGGSSIAERSRFAVETVKAIRSRVGENFPIIFRLSQWKIPDYAAKNAQTPQELEQWLAPLADAGVDIFHCSQRRFWEPEFEGSPLNLAGWAKKVTGCPTITVGSVGLSEAFLDPDARPEIATAPLDDLLARLEREEFDLVAIGRALISDPQWARKVKAGQTNLLIPYNAADLQRLY
ncbi:NADH:flavin oxidoreductase [Parasphingopyxis marina]|uniref:NADH:flavin oxidoreductase n=1 Tax=Parasphingopyxis marina TaxID=2761622 RepID=A0A842HYR4_9SPHN|nr:NADH:flavin oxidoreductase [Parasphingopyxis marina]MBC2776634.1 NADH:flavin oxidoreductase [Parasphingopyxis marina]